MARLPLSIFLIARNEADRLPRTLEAVRDLADEIILVDSGSTDATVAIAEAAGARVILNAPFPGYGPQKRVAEEVCRNDWVLNLDADEVVSPALRAELERLFAAPAALPDGFETPIVDVLPGEAEPSRFAYGLKPVRLYRRSAGRYSASTVHDRVDMRPGARIGRLKSPVWHFSIRSLGEEMEKLLRYTGMQAEDFIARGRRVSTLRVVTEFPLAFVKAYLGRRYALRGVYGFLMAMNYAMFRHLRIARIYERQRAAGAPAQAGAERKASS